MKIPGKKEDFESVKILGSTPRAPGKITLKEDSSLFEENTSDDVKIDATTQAAAKLLDPAVMEAERRAKVEDISRRYRAGAYQIPSSQMLAEKLAEEVNFEILTGRSQGTTDKELA